MDFGNKQETGLVIIDHGSRKAESNRRLDDFVDLFRAQSTYRIVEPAHMELASPDILEAFRSCVSAGVKQIIVSPFFLLPGRHWQEDIPRIAKEASRQSGNIPFLVTAPLGVHPKLVEVMEDRIQFCIASTDNQFCNSCNEFHNCRNPAG